MVSLIAHCPSTQALEDTRTRVLSCASSLETLRLYIGYRVSFAATLDSLRALTDRLPTLQILELDAELEHLRPGQKVDLALEAKDLCSSIGTLKTLRINLDVVEGGQVGFFHALSQLPELEELDVFATTSAVAMVYPVYNVGLSTSNAKFRRFKKLKLSASPPRCIEVFGTINASLSELCLEIPEPDNVGQLRQVLTAAASATSSLASLVPFAVAKPSEAAINALFMPGGVPQHVQVSSLTTVSIHIIRARTAYHLPAFLSPLLAAHRMRDFTVQHPQPLIYTADDLLDLLQMWQHIEILSLNPHPTSFHGNLDNYNLPTLEILACAAQSAPCLKYLGALLVLELPRSKPTYTWAPHVRQLDLGRSLGPATPSSSELTRKCAVVATRRYIEGLFPGVELITKDCSPWVEALARVDID